jgi:hypothetical protein
MWIAPNFFCGAADDSLVISATFGPIEPNAVLKTSSRDGFPLLLSLCGCAEAGTDFASLLSL